MFTLDSTSKSVSRENTERRKAMETLAFELRVWEGGIVGRTLNAERQWRRSEVHSLIGRISDPGPRLAAIVAASLTYADLRAKLCPCFQLKAD